MPIVIPIGGTKGDKWEPWDTPDAAKRWNIGHLVADSERLFVLREVTREEVFVKRHPKTGQALTTAEWEFLAAVITIKTAIAKKDQFTIARVLPHLFDFQRNTTGHHGQPTLGGVELEPIPSPDHLLQAPETSFTAIWVSQFLERFLSQTHLTCWVRDGTSDLQPAIFCPDLVTAIVAHVALNGDVRRCPHCGKTFVAERPKQFCCNVRCREAHRVARFRARKRQEKGK